MRTVMVIGAGGFVGRHLVRALARGSDWRPVALVRRPSPPVARSGGDAPFPEGVEQRACEASDAASLTAALAGADAAVNCVAGGAGAMIAAAGLAARLLPARARLVHLSSMVVYGGREGLVDEDAPLADGAGGYVGAKVVGERVVAARLAAGGDAVVLRPGCVHGPEGAQWTLRIGRLLAQHRLGDLGPAGDGVCNLTFVDDLVAGILAALHRADASGAVLNLSDPDPGRWNDYFGAFGRLIGATPIRRIGARRLRAETLLALPVKLAERLPLSRGAPLPEVIPPSLAALWRQEIRLDPRRADARLGLARTAPDTALRQAASWFAHRASPPVNAAFTISR